MKALIALFVLIAIAHCAEIPPFLDGASDEVVGQWIKLQEGFGEMSENQIEAAVDKFIQDHPDYKDKFDAFKKQFSEAREKDEKEHEAKIASLSPEAKDADQKLLAVTNDKTITQKEKDAKIDEIFRSLPENVAKELDQAAR